MVEEMCCIYLRSTHTKQIRHKNLEAKKKSVEGIELEEKQ